MGAKRFFVPFTEVLPGTCQVWGQRESEVKLWSDSLRGYQALVTFKKWISSLKHDWIMAILIFDLRDWGQWKVWGKNWGQN